MRKIFYPSVIMLLLAIAALIGYYVETKSFIPLIATVPMVLGSGFLVYVTFKRNLNIIRSEFHYIVMAFCYGMYSVGLGRYDHTVLAFVVIAAAVSYLAYSDFKCFEKEYQENELTKQLGVAPDYIYYRGCDFRALKEMIHKKYSREKNKVEYRHNGITFDRFGIKNGPSYDVLKRYFQETETHPKDFKKEDIEVLNMYTI